MLKTKRKISLPSRVLGLFAATALCLAATSCAGSSQKYTVDESSYRVSKRQFRRSASLASVERKAAKRYAYSVHAGVADSADEAPQAAPSPKPAPRPASRGSYNRSGGSRAKRVNQRRRTPPTSTRANYKLRRQAQQQVAKGVSNTPKEQVRAPIVYLGYLRLRVKRRLPAVDAISAMTKKAGGYIQSMQGRTLIVRIPADDFDAVMKQLSSVGEVMQRQVKALDVSRQFTDLGGRLQVAMQSRERLLALLSTVKDVNERLRIVQEVKRLSEQIESIESTLSTLRNLVNYFTITIDLDVVVPQNRRVTHASPFPWIRRLQAHYTTLKKGADELKMQVPAGFVLFDEDDDWRAQAADTSVFRAARIDNEPQGTGKFWLDAVAHELEGRDEQVEDKGTAKDMHWILVRNKDVRPRYWLIGTVAIDKDLYVVEAFYPNKKAWQSHHKAVLKALTTFEAK